MSKINKLGKSTFVVAILSFLLVAVLAFGGTYAYFTAQSEAPIKGSITMGNLHLGAVTGEIVKDKDTTGAINFETTIGQPNQVVLDNAISTTVTGNIKYYIRAKLTITVDTKHDHKAGSTGYTGTTEDPIEAKDCNDYYQDIISAFQLTIVDGTDVANWVAGETVETEIPSELTGVDAYSSKYYYVLKAHTPAESTGTTETFKIKMQANADLGNYNNTADGCEYWMEADVTVSLHFEVLQAEYLEDGATAGTGEFVADTQNSKSAVKVAEEAWAAALGHSSDTVKNK